MKNLYTLIVFVYSFCTYAQDFAFELKNRTYVNLTGSISITNGDVWDDPQYAVPLGFTISVYDTTLSTLYFSGIGSGGELSTYLAPQDIKSPLLSFVGTDVVDRGYGTATSLSDISYKVTGVVGSRIGVIEFKNVGFYY